MDIRRIQFVLFAAALLAGCQPGKSAQDASSALSSARQPEPTSAMQTIGLVHWLGMKQLSGETNAASLMAVWKLPESQRLEQQTLDKLSLAPWRLLHRSVSTNAAALLRPLLDDVVADESCLEIRRVANQPGELVFAIRLDDQRAALWQTNLAQVLESLTGIHPVPAPNHQYGWSLKKHHVPNLIELTRAGGWTLIGAAEDHNDLLDERRAGIQRGKAPLTTGNTNDWFTAEVDLRQVGDALALRWDLPADTPRISLAVTGDGTNVLGRGQADFPRPLPLDLKPWNVPTNLIDEHLASFTLIRGFQPWLESAKAWTNLQIGPPPDQVCCWALQGFPMQSYFAAQLPGASNAIDRIANLVLQNQNHWFATNGLARFESSKAFDGLKWSGLPYMSPFLRSIAVSNESFIYGGAFPNLSVNPLSLKSLQAVLGRTNLVCYDWEMTGARMDQWLYMSQFARLVSGKAQLPTESAGLLWFKAVAPKLGESLTELTQTGPSQLSFTRRSGIGFTAIELNLLADWLESPQFPRGLHTFSAPPPSQP